MGTAVIAYAPIGILATRTVRAPGTSGTRVRGYPASFEARPELALGPLVPVAMDSREHPAGNPIGPSHPGTNLVRWRTSSFNCSMSGLSSYASRGSGQVF